MYAKHMLRIKVGENIQNLNQQKTTHYLENE
uniref:Uncharacterized protein n=1 Tax=Rhizophora mucronata TaxID=61149 RepID=A0A2P2PEY6_RHIMU